MRFSPALIPTALVPRALGFVVGWAFVLVALWGIAAATAAAGGTADTDTADADAGFSADTSTGE